MSMWVRNGLLGLIAVLLVAVPLLFLQGAEWGGADTLSTEAIQELQPDYQPWFEPLFSAADAGIEGYLFGLQALIGSVVLSAVLGWLIGRNRAQYGGGAGDQRTAGIVCAVAIAIAVVLLFVQTEFGELEAFKLAFQGVLVGLLGFFLGYPAGRRQTVASSPPSAGAAVGTDGGGRRART